MLQRSRRTGLSSGRINRPIDRSIDNKTAWPQYQTNLVLRTVRANLTSAAPPASSASQMYGENEDSYVKFYIQTEHGIACETTLQLL